MLSHAKSNLAAATFFKAVAGSLLALSALSFAQAAEQPPIRLVVPFPPGGSTDIASRIIQPKLAELLSRDVVIENKPGAATQIASQYVQRSKPDGNTLLVSFDSHSLNPIVRPLPYDTFKDFRGITFALRFPLVVGVSKHVEANSLKEFVAAAKADPKKYSYASTGLGSLNHLAPEELKRMAGIEMLHVPFAGGGQAMQSLVGNITHMAFLSYAAFKPQIEAGNIKPLAVTGAKRIADLPDVPTVKESGYPDFEAYSWIGIFAPAGTPDDIANPLTDAFQKALNDKEVKAKLANLGFEVMATDGPTVDRYAVEQYQRWSTFVKDTGLSLAK
ncbi:Bug family tripartite tricarboxylate transporter substrate binding protein [Pollutimonas harenae]|uniref:Tripartite tricarboxylate transporter substrate binding protein n=1 Tax=Pollutimonas harenae TaxID=657015 RepID=A0A853GQ15_9BURK|nr:tripartite tricarboxylate transporter substrate binding protein [Pollutimonas harenae]NYT84257.1 tripartite tricarboxylate transporter substrate binding protein [Pollutimonas harenae]TEA73333.1 tripartite tricarboxylate transporter substrate binding protein [Pollutimonas harenae]